ncbi:hypothetical protein DICVIV_11544 [Dictyocaulus viviparus]|uniref:Uncharacterized protein n=1 Tax=Dictyocaulus viviparus TaxID=29172 RepID=A0A0D8XFD6_DICVI|nr:hypothetical protein DICVIV_11544 [Dictyocaulus viviparus]
MNKTLRKCILDKHNALRMFVASRNRTPHVHLPLKDYPTAANMSLLV